MTKKKSYLPHLHVVNNAFLLLEDHMLNFSLIDPLIIIIRQPKLPRVGIAMTKLHPLTHPWMLDNAHNITRNLQNKFQLIGPLISFGCPNNFLWM